MKRLICKLRRHRWTEWHLVHRIVQHRLLESAHGAEMVTIAKPLYLYTRRCYRCGCEEFREEVGE